MLQYLLPVAPTHTLSWPERCPASANVNGKPTRVRVGSTSMKYRKESLPTVRGDEGRAVKDPAEVSSSSSGSVAITFFKVNVRRVTITGIILPQEV